MTQAQPEVRFAVDLQMSDSPNCPDACIGNVNNIVTSFIDGAIDTNTINPEQGAEKTYDITCQARCEGPEKSGFLQRKCGMVASLHLFDDTEKVILQGTFHNDA